MYVYRFGSRTKKCWMFLWRRPLSSAMPAPEGEKERESEEETTESSYEEVEEEVEAKPTVTLAPKAKGVAKKAAARPPVGVSSSDSVSPAPTRPARGHGGRDRPNTPREPPEPPKNRELPRGRSPAPTVAKASKRKPSSSDSGPGEGIHKGRKGSQKGKGKQQHQRCDICWSKVALGQSCLKQHQRWNTTCITWSFHNQGMPWEEAQQKAQRTKARRERKAWGEDAAPSRPSPEKCKAEKKEKRKKTDRKKRRVSPSPEARAPDRKRYKKDPDNSSGEDRLPKVRARGQDIIIRLPRAR